jgi:hypothetical protein
MSSTAGVWTCCDAARANPPRRERLGEARAAPASAPPRRGPDSNEPGAPACAVLLALSLPCIGCVLGLTGPMLVVLAGALLGTLPAALHAGPGVNDGES